MKTGLVHLSEWTMSRLTENVRGGALIFICQGTSTRRQRSLRGFLSSSQAATYYYQSNHSLVEAIPLSASPKDTTSKLASLFSHQ